MFDDEFEGFLMKYNAFKSSIKLPPTSISIPMFSGRPDRDITITSDEILNLRILLETSETVEAFEAAIA